jgi:hypothetical protein
MCYGLVMGILASLLDGLGNGNVNNFFFAFGATTPILALAYLHETHRFTSGY